MAAASQAAGALPRSQDRYLRTGGPVVRGGVGALFLVANAGALSAANVALSEQMSLLRCRRNADQYNVI